MSLIKAIEAHKVLNSRADWTVFVRVLLEDGTEVTQTVPEGASKGEHEAVSLPVEEALENIKINIAPALIGESPFDQKKIDQALLKLDGTENKSNLGCNAILPVSLAMAKVAAKSKDISLYAYLKDIYGNANELKFPTPLFNILNGGKHAQNDLSFQEFMVIPGMGFSFERKLEIGVDCYKKLAEKLAEEGLSTGVGDEGGFAPQGVSVTQALKELAEAVDSAGYKLGEDVFLGTDVAAGSFYDSKKNRYVLKDEDAVFSREEFFTFYEQLLKDYPLIYLEDPLFESDFDSWSSFFVKFNERTMVVGDDLVVTNPEILEEALDKKTINAVIIKPNQVGTLTETFEFIRLAQENGLVTVVSHRSGETAEDTFVSDLALAVGADFVKFGAPARGERVVKYNRLLDLYHRSD
jgi:enolase